MHICVHVYMCVYIYLSISLSLYIYIYIYIYMYTTGIGPTCHILPPSEIELGLFWADFTDLKGKHLFHRIG